MQLHEVETLRRSLAMAPLARADVEELLDTCQRLLAERVRMERILRDLGPAWGGTRRALNELSKVLREPPSKGPR